jgi:hypothetical protein
MNTTTIYLKNIKNEMLSEGDNCYGININITKLKKWTEIIDRAIADINYMSGIIEQSKHDKKSSEGKKNIIPCEKTMSFLDD